MVIYMKKINAFLGAILLSIGFMTSCSDTTAEITNSQSESSASPLCVKFVEDYQYVWSMLEENFPLMGALERACGDLEKLKIGWQEKVEQCETQQEFHDTMSEFSVNLRSVGHLFFISEDMFSYFRDTYHGLSPEEYPQVSELLKVFDNEDVLETYHQTESITPGPSSEPTSEYAEPISVEYPTEDTVLIHIPDFTYDQTNNEAMLAAYEEAEQKDVKNLILDLTENSGGNDNVWQDYIVSPNISEPVSYTKYILLPVTEYNRSFWEPAGMLEGIKPIEELPEFPSLSQEDIRLCNYFKAETETFEPSQNAPLFSGKIYALVGPAVYSSSESFAYFCKETGFATLVGETTGGDGISFGDPLYFELPNTHYIFRYTASYGLNSDGSCNAEKGTKPDIFCRANETPLDACLKAIKNNSIH